MIESPTIAKCCHGMSDVMGVRVIGPINGTRARPGQFHPIGGVVSYFKNRSYITEQVRLTI